MNLFLFHLIHQHIPTGYHKTAEHDLRGLSQHKYDDRYTGGIRATQDTFSIYF